MEEDPNTATDRKITLRFLREVQSLHAGEGGHVMSTEDLGFNLTKWVKRKALKCISATSFDHGRLSQ